MPTPVSNVAGEQLILQLGNGAMPEVFTATCTINTTRSLDLTAAASVTEIADCLTPSNPASTYRQVKSIDWKFTGAGVSDGPSLLALMQWWQSGLRKNVKVIQNLTGAQGGYTVTGPAVVTNLNQSGARGDMQLFTITVEGAAAPTITANP